MPLFAIKYFSILFLLLFRERKKINNQHLPILPSRPICSKPLRMSRSICGIEREKKGKKVNMNALFKYEIAMPGLAWPVRETTKNYDDDDDMLCFAAAALYTSLVEMCEIVSTFYPQILTLAKR